ncbi:MAG: hypothetical protein ABSH09_01725 [Bryobacteraceae bacterium]|jgi:hypothetical protein
MADVFRLTKEITGIRFSPEGRGLLTTLPIDAQLSLIGQSSMPGFLDVTYNNNLYRIFLVDLMARSVNMRTMAAAA